MKSHFLLTLSHLYRINTKRASGLFIFLPLQRILCSTAVLAMCEPGLGSCCRLDWRETRIEDRRARCVGLEIMRKKEDKKMSERQQKEKEEETIGTYSNINKYQYGKSNSQHLKM